MNTGAASLSDERERAAITACALMIKGICLTRPNAEWTGAIEDRIQFMLKQMQAGAAIAAGGAQEADDAEISEHLIKRMSNLLAGVAIALKGAEEAMTRHGYQDLPELAAKLMCEVELHRAREAEMTDHDRTACNNVYQMMTEGYAGPLPRVATPVMPDDTSAFKNFHRQLCERFGYVHDEKDWRRDQVSLIEWIAKRLAPAAPSVEQDERGAFDKALMAYAMEFSESIDAEKIRVAHKRVMELFESRAASTSANVAQGDNAALIHAFDSALSGVPRYVIDRFGVEHVADGGGWIKESDLFDRFAASTSANVAQGADWSDRELNIHPDFKPFYAPFMKLWEAQVPTSDMKSLCFFFYRHGAQTANVAQGAEAVGWFVRRSKFGPWVEVEQQEPGAEQFYRGAPPAQTALTDAARDAIRRETLKEPVAQTELALTDDEVWQALKDIADLHSHPDDVVQAGRALLTAAQSAGGDTK
jgi:hypothetical protein